MYANKNLQGGQRQVVVVDKYGTQTRGPVRIKVEGIDGLTLGDNDIFTTESGFGQFIVTNFYMIGKNITGTPIGNPAGSIGDNNPTYDNILITSVLPMSANDEVGSPATTNALSIHSVAPSTAVKFTMSSIGSGYTNYIFDLFLEGFYELS